MAEVISLEAQKRQTLGKAVKRLRKDGLVPAVIHDHGKDSVHIQAEYQSLSKIFQQAGRHHPVELSVDGKKYTALIRQATFDPRHNQFMHVVFNAVKANEKVVAAVPLKPHYSEGNEASPAERAGLIVLAQLEEIEVKALPRDLPDQLFYDAEKLVAVGDQATVADITVPTGVVLETEPEHVVATVFEPSALAAANEDAGGDNEDTKPTGDETPQPAGGESQPADGKDTSD